MDADQPVAIIGGGIAGLTVARLLAENGLESIIIEKSPSLGGNVRNWACMATNECLRCGVCGVEDILEQVRASDRVTLLEGHELVEAVHSGDGPKRLTVRKTENGNATVLDAAAVVVATGFEPYDPSEKVFWGYGRLPAVMTLAELDEIVRRDETLEPSSGADEPLKIAFFQCVGSRDRSIGAAYCSQYCCKGALRMALKLKHERPEREITVFYIDLQVAGKFAGRLLSEADKKGIRLLQGVPGEITQSSPGALEIVREADGRNVKESFHKIVLSVGQRPSVGTRTVASVLGADLDDFGYIRPKDLLDSGRTTLPGVYLAGTCAGPKDIEQTILHSAQAAAAVTADLNGARPRKQ
jgi:heterodisulfide reductase subunit A